MRNPCHDCDHHLACGSKNDSKCMKCEKRIVYVNYIGPMAATLDPGKTLNGHGGHDMPDIEEKTSAPETDLNLEFSEAEKIIHRICEKNLSDIDRIRAGHRNWRFNTAIQEIVDTLAGENKISNTEIAKILNITPSAVWQRLNKEKRRKYKKEKKKKMTDHKKDTPKEVCKDCGVGFGEMHLSSCGKVKAEKSDRLVPKKPKKNDMGLEHDRPQKTDPGGNDNKYRLEIDFENHTDIYESLVDTAEDEFRDPDKQILWILKNVYERGLEAEKEA